MTAEDYHADRFNDRAQVQKVDIKASLCIESMVAAAT
jgi:hypothetical protein